MNKPLTITVYGKEYPIRVKSYDEFTKLTTVEFVDTDKILVKKIGELTCNQNGFTT